MYGILSFGTGILGFVILAFLLHPLYLIGAGLLMFIWGSVHYGYRFSQLTDFSELEINTNTLVLIEERKIQITKECKEYLTELYPKYETEIFEKMSNFNLLGLMGKFPEIKNDEMIKTWINLIKEQIELEFTLKRKITKLESRIKLRTVESKAWVFSGTMPTSF